MAREYKKRRFGDRSGCPNRNSLQVLRALADRKFDPFVFMCAVAQGDHDFLKLPASAINMDHRIAATKALMPYCAPQLKAVEITHDSTEPLIVQLVQFSQLSAEERASKELPDYKPPPIIDASPAALPASVTLPVPPVQITKYARQPRKQGD